MAGEDAQVPRGTAEQALAVEPPPPDFEETQVEKEPCVPITKSFILCLCV